MRGKKKLVRWCGKFLCFVIFALKTNAYLGEELIDKNEFYSYKPYKKICKILRATVYDIRIRDVVEHLNEMIDIEESYGNFEIEMLATDFADKLIEAMLKRQEEL